MAHDVNTDHQSRRDGRPDREGDTEPVGSRGVLIVEDDHSLRQLPALRAHGVDVPVIFLTARHDVTDRLSTR